MLAEFTQSHFRDLVHPLAECVCNSVAGDDFGKIRLYAFPCVVEDAPSRTYTAHSSHVSAVSFTYDNRWLVSVGGADRAVCQWVLEAKARDVRESVGFEAVPKLTVLAPPPDTVVELPHVEYAADGEELEELEEGVLVDSAAEQVAKVELWVLAIQVVTSDIKCVTLHMLTKHTSQMTYSCAENIILCKLKLYPIATNMPVSIMHTSGEPCIPKKASCVDKGLISGFNSLLPWGMNLSTSCMQGCSYIRPGVPGAGRE